MLFRVLALTALCHAAIIQSVSDLGASIAAANSDVGRSVGFLSQGNYQAVASVLPKNVVVKVYEDLLALEAAVVAGEIVAGLSTSRPDNADGHLIEFPASLITMRASMTKPPGSAPDTQQLREAWDAAIVRAISDGDYQELQSQYFQSDGFDSVAAFTCGIDPTKFPFPAAADATGLLADVLARGVLRVGALGPSNWGYQGNYLLGADATGFWPDYMKAIFDQFSTAYPGVRFERVWNSTSDGVMDSVISGSADLTEPYWTVSAWYHGRARSEHLELCCTVLGTENIFFTKGAGAANGSDNLPTYGIVLICLSAGLALMFALLVFFMYQAERRGEPVFKSLAAPLSPVPAAPNNL